MWCACRVSVQQSISHSESWNRKNTIFFISDTFSPWEGERERGRKKNHNDKAHTKHRVRINDVKFCLRCLAAYSIFTFSVRNLRARSGASSVLYTFIYMFFFFFLWLSDLFYFISLLSSVLLCALCRRRSTACLVRVQLKNVNRIYIPSHFTDANPAAIYHRQWCSFHANLLLIRWIIFFEWVSRRHSIRCSPSHIWKSEKRINACRYRTEWRWNGFPFY